MGNEQVRIGIIDTGIGDRGHFGSRVVLCADFTLTPPAMDACEDTSGHGTHLAAIVAADGDIIEGLVPSAELYVYRVCDDADLCSAAAIAMALRDAADRGLDVVLIGLAGSDSTPEEATAIEAFRATGGVVVAPTGNTGDMEGVGFPGRLPSVIGVGAVGPESVVTGFSASSSLEATRTLEGFGGVSVVAPGVDVIGLDETGAVELRTGTSQAAAIVTGVIGRYISTGYSPTAAADCLLATANDLIDPIGSGQEFPGYDGYSGFGLVTDDEPCP